MAKKTAKKSSGSKAIINNAKASASKSYKNYYNSSAYKNAQKLQGMTINDIAKKYGFDFSQKYANQQAKVAADAQRNTYNSQQRTNDSSHTNTMSRIQDQYDSSAGQLDHNYFKQFGNQQQSLADRGLNAGIAANANLQLGMNRQNDLTNLMKQSNSDRQQEDMRYSDQNQTISDALAQVDKQQSLDAKNNYQNLLSQGYNILNGDRSAATNWANMMWGQTSDQVNNNMDFANMNLNDYYKQQDLAQQAANRAASLKAAKLAAGGGGSGGGSSVPSSAQKYVSNYANTLNNQTKGHTSYNTPLDKYAGSLGSGFKAVQNSNSPLVHKYLPNPYSVDTTSVANNPSLSAWDKYKLMGF